MKYEKKIQKIASYITKRIESSPVLAIILGSGLSGIENLIKDPIIIPYKSIPHYPKSSVQGHKNRFIFGYVQNKPILLCSGRFHFYEGFTFDTVTLPIRVLKKIGVQNLLLTNAAGGIANNFAPTDIMLITDHINLSGNNPLIGYQGTLPIFIDMSTAYSSALIKKLTISARSLKINLKKGIYAFQTGPTYETPAEIQMLKKIGAHAVGMSTVPEVLVAHQEGIPTIAFSTITNKAAGLSKTKLGHNEVLENSLKAQKKIITLIKKFITTL